MDSHLVLLDEVGANTNEAEGKALNIAILNKLQNNGSTTILSTHFEIEEMKKYLPQINPWSITQDHKLLPYNKDLNSNGWIFCKQRGFI